ncbi:hypothetical protein CP533_4883 [Ophiocordyceps camponoti-saundersi (nom. inval.)]|nr:hypothetical protein CP533_4883 [Ophiocordyceps camponoti-saundersi (nom. inval.)]
MDPLSITASALTLIQAAGLVTKTLNSVVRSLRTVDSRVALLSKELTDLTSFLEAINTTLKGCRTVDLGLVDDGLWHQSEIALANCQTTLNELAQLVGKIDRSNQTKRFARKIRTVVDLNIYGDELVIYRDRLHQSNSALQTMLHTINVSLSVRNHASQDLILKELDRLDASINEALHASSRPVGGFYKSDNASFDARFGRNLRQLAEAAKHFHTTASSTAGTVRSDSSDDVPSQSYAGAEMSLCGDFPVSRRERVEEFINRQTVRSPEPIGKPSPPLTHPSNNDIPVKLARSSTIEQEEDDDAELERDLWDGFRKLATASFRARNYDKATKVLQEAMTQDVKPGRAGEDEYRQMQLELALCHLCQTRWRQAAPLVLKLANSEARHDLTICNLLHALALGYLAECMFDDAFSTCKKALQGKNRLCKGGHVEWNEYWETLGLYATIFDVTGDGIRAQVFRLKLPANFAYIHPANEVDFIRFRTGLLQTIFGDDAVVSRTQDSIVELDGGNGNADDDNQESGTHRSSSNNGDNNSISQRMTLQDDTAKEVVAVDSPTSNYADDENSPNSATQTSPLRRRLSRFLRARRRRPINSGNAMPESPLSSNSSPSVSSPLNLTWDASNVGSLARKRKNLTAVVPFKGPLHRCDDTGAFKLLRMERVMTPTTPVKDHGFARRWEPIFPVQSQRHHDTNYKVLLSHHHTQRHASEQRTITQHRLNTCQGGLEAETCHDRYSHDAQIHLCRAELGDTGLSKLDAELTRRQNMHVRRWLPSTLEYISEDRDSKERKSQDSVRYLRDSVLCSLEMDAMEARVFVTEPGECSLIEERRGRPLAEKRSSSLGPEKTRLEDGEERPSSQSDADISEADDSQVNSGLTTTPSSETSSTTSVSSKTSAPISPELERILTRLSIIMASLNGLKDGSDLRAKQLMLKALIPRLKANSSDPTVVNDTERVIDSLDAAASSPASWFGDSGYESMASARGQKTVDMLPDPASHGE